jgi:hypothetical protein
MSKKPELPTYKGRSLGITTLTAAQVLIGVIHIISGAVLFAFENFSILPVTAAYDVYTFFYGLLVLVFAVYLWKGKKAGWIGTIAVSFFVIAADTLTLLNLPSIPGIPKAPAFAEIAYSLIVVIYLMQANVRNKKEAKDLS